MGAPGVHVSPELTHCQWFLVMIVLNPVAVVPTRETCVTSTALAILGVRGRLNWISPEERGVYAVRKCERNH